MVDTVELSSLGYETTGNDVTVSGISPVSGHGGNIDIIGGVGVGDAGGTVNLIAGLSDLGGGSAGIRGGNSETSGDGGSAVVLAGDSQAAGNGGSVYISSGNALDGNAGNIDLTAGYSGGSNSYGVIRLIGAIVKIIGIPTADPLIANALYIDSITRVLKVSAG